MDQSCLDLNVNKQSLTDIDWGEFNFVTTVPLRVLLLWFFLFLFWTRGEVVLSVLNQGGVHCQQHCELEPFGCLPGPFRNVGSLINN